MDLTQNLKDNTVPLPVAEQMCENWRQMFMSIFPHVDPATGILRAFRIPIEDIIALGSYHGAAAARAYLSLETPGDPSSIKLLIVPVVLNQDNQEVDKPCEAVPAPTISNIYDLTQPCPVLCDSSSPLYGPVTKP